MNDLTALRDSGLLWLINTTVFHPRGFAMAIHYEDGQAVGWSLLGDGTEPWGFADDNETHDAFERAKATLAAQGEESA